MRLIAKIVFICFTYFFTSKSTAMVMSGHQMLKGTLINKSNKQKSLFAIIRKPPQVYVERCSLLCDEALTAK